MSHFLFGFFSNVIDNRNLQSQLTRLQHKIENADANHPLALYGFFREYASIINEAVRLGIIPKEHTLQCKCILRDINNWRVDQDPTLSSNNQLSMLDYHAKNFLNYLPQLREALPNKLNHTLLDTLSTRCSEMPAKLAAAREAYAANLENFVIAPNPPIAHGPSLVRTRG